jgi:hypothetical protein
MKATTILMEVDSINDKKYQMDDIHQVTKFDNMDNMDILFMNFNTCHSQQTCHHGSQNKKPPMKTRGTPVVQNLLTLCFHNVNQFNKLISYI